MINKKDRLLALIEFAQQAARLQSKPAATVAQHGLLALYEHQIQGLPGIRVHVHSAEDEDEIWLAVERLQETKPPDIPNILLRPWVQMTHSPDDQPRLRQSADGASLIQAGTHHSPQSTPEQGQPAIDPEATVILAEYDKAEQVRAQFSTYMDTRWRPWAEEEKLRRKSIRLYSQLFTLKQQLEGGIVETPLELIWGVGMGVWNYKGTIVSYPLVGRLVELSLNPKTAEVEIRPRDVDPRLELDWYASIDNPGVATLEKAAKVFFGAASVTFSPFDRDTFEYLLRTATAHLDGNGIYWPTQVPAEDRTLPTPDDKLKVTDTWVLFARPRTNNLFVQDLENLKKQVLDAEVFPGAVNTIVTDPDTVNPDVVLPSFRGVSASYHAERAGTGKRVRDLYFPKPFNDEQVRIIQMLEVSPGVVVQGPPGTGKTHTIANVICHYLAEGKRVLVTSMKDPALAVLQEQLPSEIRPLAISLLTSEQDGMKQFEHAIHKIASEVQGLDRPGTAKAISHLEERIDGLHGKLAGIDRRIDEWAKRNLTQITLDTEETDPQDAALEVVENATQFEWIPDKLGISPEYAPQFTDADVVRLRDARRALGNDIEYLESSLPQVTEFPEFKVLLDVHHDLSQFERLKRAVESGNVPALADASHETLTLSEQLLPQIETLQRLRDEVTQAERPWVASLMQRLRRGGDKDFLTMLEILGTELEQADEQRKGFLQWPVTVPTGMEVDTELVEAVHNLAAGKSPFGLKGLIGKSDQKKKLDSIRVLGQRPIEANNWKHVTQYLKLLKQLRALAVRWNALAHELGVETVSGDNPEGGLAAAHGYALYRKLKALVRAEGELCTAASAVFPTWIHAREVAYSTQRLSELEQALRHHLTKNRLAHVWATKERCQKVLEGRSGRIIDELRHFFSDLLGNPAVSDADLQSRWSALMAELSRVLSLSTHLSAVREVCQQMERSGAPGYAALLKQPLTSTVDGLLPDSWRKAWRLRRLSTYLESIDAQDELKKLARERRNVEEDLSRAYQDIVVKRTWLKLAENASPSIRAALQAYLNAIQRMGTGKGKRAVRYRQDARVAAAQANPAVPCWIMAHYRVSESLPAELGCFDLVVIDEASQSDLTALPSLLRAKKVLIVGDDKQVSPEGVGLEEEKVRSLMNRFLAGQVETYRAQMSPERSIYDLCKVVFAQSAVMLKEHFRCVGPIIEYSKREFYNHELRPLRIPKTSERLDPPLIDVLVADGYRKGNVNLPEARFIVDEIKAIVSDPRMSARSIGIVSLLGDEQALEIWERLTTELGPEVMHRHRIACGGARTFQGKERDIMFLSMVAAPNPKSAPLTRDTFAQRFNVAASRARDRMYLVRSVDLEHLSEADKYRRSLITHFATPYAQDEARVEDLRKLCESDFEREVYDELTQRGYRVTPQVRVGQYRIDLVVEGHNDLRLAVECDGDKYHGPEKWADDIRRQRDLERARWVFWRCFASAFLRRRKEMLDDLLATLAERGIESIGAEGAPRSVHTEHRLVEVTPEAANQGASLPVEVPETLAESASTVPPPPRESPPGVKPPEQGRLDLAIIGGDRTGRPARRVHAVGSPEASLPLNRYTPYVGPAGSDPRAVSVKAVSEGLVRIIEVEGPLLAHRAYDIYLQGCGIKRMGGQLKHLMNKALAHAVRSGRVVSVDEAARGGLLQSIVRVKGTPPIKVRSRGPRSLEEIPPSELKVVARYLVEQHGFAFGSEEHLRAVLEVFELKRLTTQVSTLLQKTLEKSFPYEDESLSAMCQ